MSIDLDDIYPGVICPLCGHMIAILEDPDDATDPFLVTCPKCRRDSSYRKSQIVRLKPLPKLSNDED